MVTHGTCQGDLHDWRGKNEKSKGGDAQKGGDVRVERPKTGGDRR